MKHLIKSTFCFIISTIINKTVINLTTFNLKVLAGKSQMLKNMYTFLQVRSTNYTYRYSKSPSYQHHFNSAD